MGTVMTSRYDVIVIGGGHAGCEAALAAARMGASTAIFTLNLNMIAQMSCNPSIGGIAKGHLVREIDALGGVMGEVADRAGIQFRLLNRRRGPAVQAPRAQCDKQAYRREMQRLLASQSNLTGVAGEVTALLERGGRIAGVEIRGGGSVSCNAVVLTTGTFLNGLCHVGERKFQAGRSGEAASLKLAHSVRSLGLTTGRLKTGTPPRLDRNSINFARFEIQKGEDPPPLFSFRSEGPSLRQVPCWIGYTNPSLHQLIRENLDRSPLYSGEIQGIGPRYCPSIEDKVVKFAHRDRHQLFLEPEGLHANTIYLNGLSTCLPATLQQHLLERIEGLENAVMTRPGYAVEYDFVQPTQLDSSLQTRALGGLFHAGQINGTTGYEEAAAQGLVAGINAALHTRGEKPFVLGRQEAYIGILIDDLVTQGVDEPYRMFTSRAEYRLLLRIDNADRRLMGHGRRLGLISDDVYRQFHKKWERVERAAAYLRGAHLKPGSHAGSALAHKLGINGSVSLERLLRRPDCSWSDLAPLLAPEGLLLNRNEQQQIENQIKYQGYIDRQKRDVERAQGRENQRIPTDFPFQKVPGLSREMVERLCSIRPSSLGQASRMGGHYPRGPLGSTHLPQTRRLLNLRFLLEQKLRRRVDRTTKEPSGILSPVAESLE